MPVLKRQGAMMSFVVSTGVEKPDPELRKFIRSHVMLGKNRGKTLRPRRREPKAIPVGDSSPSSEGDTREPSCPSLSASHSIIPRKVGSDLATARFADTVEPYAVEVVLRFSSIAKQTLFPLESCIAFERREELWIEPLAFDPAYLHALIFSTHDYFDTVLLRERLLHEDDQARLSTTTISVVLTLAAHAHFIGESESAKHHLQGLHKIVNLRGGVTAFKDNAKLLIEMLSGSKPVFFNNEPYSDLGRLRNLDVGMKTDDSDISLVKIDESYLHTMSSTIYPLIHMSFEDQQISLHTSYFGSS
ncbi:hypothetical protein DL764_005964 [Monosporascus ibericus]|uniref:Uncharacterized protein n=1 Tax=Monosporascus ibericus TaxID=155417 RepID=A0A4Q4TAI9_9PEZI|nr:hypothetical protein DL764_005964 [Monosporascus ibericus]